ncbi:glycosyltransferase family 2 protein [Sediminispirochaeta smaragdinae]|uniref:Glycosyl transferase family 2 n=1 Tax=Sediminispirochaeta smaragdinae (strain DSM 11293 / JCM 15392 / SEBR 4228) TaxID=573413 RepID=E1RBT4_SEDSS|nr:glycosyltransferase family 2 protein [Sediminispirochaeta smaragdinae]ADK79814.1 glycosyl transferase family 2 [Sediminispirochaeta smaragdinae DSM 11293]
MIDIVVPVYNEGKNIKNLFTLIEDKISTEKEVIIVYDFEEDDTLPVVKGILSDYSFPIRLQRNLYGRGALNAIVSGFRSAKEEAVLVIMADLSDSLEVVDSMFKKIKEDHYDLVCGSRYMRGGKQNGGPFLKGVFSRLAGLSLHLFTRIPTHDISNSFKMYRKSMLDSIEIESDGGFEVGMEITVKAYLSGYKITEIPSEWFDRSEGESNFKMWKWLPHYLHWYGLCIRRSWFKNHLTIKT